MMHKLIVLSVFLGFVFADPVARISSSIDDLDESVHEVVNSDGSKRVPRLILVPFLSTLICDVIKVVIGKKFDALSLAVSAINWLVSNSLVIVIGAVTALGVCKLTGKCSLGYEEVIPVPQLATYVTPEHIDTAERFLISAVEKYAEERST